MYKYFKRIAGAGNGNYIYYLQSKGLSDERTNSVKTANHSITPNLDCYGTQTRTELHGNCLKENKVPFKDGKVGNIYIVYERNKILSIRDYPTLKNCLFGAVALPKNTDINKYRYSGYEITFHRHGSFSFPCSGLGRYLIIFGVNMSSSTKIDNRKIKGSVTDHNKISQITIKGSV